MAVSATTQRSRRCRGTRSGKVRLASISIYWGSPQSMLNSRANETNDVVSAMPTDYKSVATTNSAAGGLSVGYAVVDAGALAEPLACGLVVPDCSRIPGNGRTLYVETHLAFVLGQQIAGREPLLRRVRSWKRPMRRSGELQ